MATERHHIDLTAFEDYLVMALEHYGKCAPSVATYLDDLYVRMNEAPETVCLFELRQTEGLLENGQWEHPSLAANRVMKLLDRLGRDITGQLGF